MNSLCFRRRCCRSTWNVQAKEELMSVKHGRLGKARPEGESENCEIEDVNVRN